MKKLLSIVICIISLFGIFTLSSCEKLEELENAVNYPDAYSITYEITNADGTIHTITKTVDENGSVYIKTADTEKLFIKNDDSYTLYEKNTDGKFVAESDKKYTEKVVNETCAEFEKYADESKNKFMPTAKKDGEDELAGRKCEIYKLGVGTENNSAYYYYYVDIETGICLGVKVKQTALGNEIEHEGDSFICKEFITANIEDLSDKISK